MLLTAYVLTFLIAAGLVIARPELADDRFIERLRSGRL